MTMIKYIYPDEAREKAREKFKYDGRLYNEFEIYSLEELEDEEIELFRIMNIKMRGAKIRCRI